MTLYIFYINIDCINHVGLSTFHFSRFHFGWQSRTLKGWVLVVAKVSLRIRVFSWHVHGSSINGARVFLGYTAAFFNGTPHLKVQFLQQRIYRCLYFFGHVPHMFVKKGFQLHDVFLFPHSSPTFSGDSLDAHGICYDVIWYGHDLIYSAILLGYIYIYTHESECHMIHDVMAIFSSHF